MFPYRWCCCGSFVQHLCPWGVSLGSGTPWAFVLFNSTFCRMSPWWNATCRAMSCFSPSCNQSPPPGRIGLAGFWIGCYCAIARPQTVKAFESQWNVQNKTNSLARGWSIKCVMCIISNLTNLIMKSTVCIPRTTRGYVLIQGPQYTFARGSKLLLVVDGYVEWLTVAAGRSFCRELWGPSTRGFWGFWELCARDGFCLQTLG